VSAGYQDAAERLPRLPGLQTITLLLFHMGNDIAEEVMESIKSLENSRGKREGPSWCFLDVASKTETLQ